ncbi:hypothetical protein [Kribbia dieselivorans]|uniref:hypothetical protein n=1 Tax=Kribbia dieselivorans TaxID=331526 RepID=UPI000839047B|nr:hypothetical protein [Kribbia dieselivorans]
MQKKKWSELSSGQRRFMVVAGVFEGVLKVAALVDLARRPADQVRGNKVAWATAITVINAFGAVPIAYFVKGRRPT